MLAAPSSRYTGAQAIAAGYSGDTNFTGSSGTLSGADGRPGGHDDDSDLVDESVGVRPERDVHGDGDGGSGTFDNGGTVTFAVDGSNDARAVSLSGGSATLADTALSNGTHTITASYSGDTNFSPAAAR